jgi:cell fate regulator YaaT (PSP1 superfamily)
MTEVVGVRFKDSGKTYYFDPRGIELVQGDHVIVETVRGLEMARVAFARREVADSDIVGELKPVIRRAEPADLERMRSFQARHDEVLARCHEKIVEHNLPMGLVKAEYSFDGSRLTFFFTSEKRVDFRLLVRDLARTFKSRIELRQIGPRDEAKLLGGIGPCGRMLCCATFLPDYARVSIKMAKDQDLPLNPTKISGVCGRLLCCLSYEHEQYVEMRAELPRRGSWVQTPDGPGEVVSQNVLKQQVIVQLASSGMHETYNLDQVQAATEQVAATARARAAEGITPRPHHEPKQRGERHFLREQIESYDAVEGLELIEDESDPPLHALENFLERSTPRPEPQGPRSGPPQGQRQQQSANTPRPPAGSRERPPTTMRVSRQDGSGPAQAGRTGERQPPRREAPKAPEQQRTPTPPAASSGDQQRQRRRRRSGRGGTGGEA